MKRAADMTDAEIEWMLDNPPPRIGPYAVSVQYVALRDEVVLRLDTRVTMVIPRDAIDELREVPQSQLKRIELMGDGDAVAVHAADVHISVEGLVRDMIGLDRARPVAPRKTRSIVPATAARKRRPARAT